jgi:outer membrane protein assembly factor BamB
MPNVEVMHFHRMWRFLACGFLAALLAGPLSQAARAEPMWTTYHRDAQRSGYDPDATQPIPPALAWQTVDLGAPIWSQPLVLGERVYAATVGGEVYALEASTGKVVWVKSVGTPVPSEEGFSKLPCGDIEPTVGVVGTPVIDPSTQTLYLVADTWDAAREEAHHFLVGLNLTSGEQVLRTAVDPPGADPKTLLQRTALNLDAGRVIFGFGGNDGDCGTYRGAVVAVPENGGAPMFWQYQPAEHVTGGAAVWGTSGPAVDQKGIVYAATGNPNPESSQKATVVDRSDNVVQLDLEHSFVADPFKEASTPLGFFVPPTWLQDSNNDVDLGSAGPELLPGGLLFQAGKNGTGYLIDEATMSSGAKAVFEAEVCNGAGSFGGDALAGGVIYLPCTDGVQALAYDSEKRTFTPLWQGPSDAVGPPIVSAGLVWVVATGGFNGGGAKLYGLDPLTGNPRYTETLPSPVVDHFASPSAAGGRLFVASGSSVTAYQISQLPPPPPSSSTTKASVPAGSKAVRSKTPTLLLRTHLHASRTGVVHLALRCTIKSGTCRGVIALRAVVVVRHGTGRHRVSHTVLVPLVSKSFGPAKGDFTVTLRLGRRAMAQLRRHHDRLAVQVTISSPGDLARHVPAVLR